MEKQAGKGFERLDVLNKKAGGYIHRLNEE
jgi:hypothetical protein